MMALNVLLRTVHRKPGGSFVHKVPFNNAGGNSNAVRRMTGSCEDLCRV